VLVEIGETWLVVGVAPGQVSALHQMPRGQIAAAAALPAGKDFGAWLKQMMERRHAARRLLPSCCCLPRRPRWRRACRR
jgi:flagellar protein FliO/FliZ